MSEVFISYAHADDLPFAEDTPGWVTALADRLEKSLMMRRGGSRVAVWMDHRLEPEKQVDGALRDRVRRAECFVAVLSPRYLESPWCRKELDAFIAQAGEQGERVFLLEMSPTSREEWPRGSATSRRASSGHRGSMTRRPCRSAGPWPIPRRIAPTGAR